MARLIRRAIILVLLFSMAVLTLIKTHFSSNNSSGVAQAQNCICDPDCWGS
jgi:hypothetical protein